MIYNSFDKFDNVKNVSSLGEKDDFFLAGGTAGILGCDFKELLSYELLESNDFCDYAPTEGKINLKHSYLKYSSLYDFSDDNIIVTSGATPAIFATLKTLFKEGDVIAILMPCWSIYLSICEALKINVIKLYPKNDSHQYDLNEINNAKGLLIATPSNPTGKIISTDNFKDILHFSKKNYVISDETYYGLEIGNRRITFANYIDTNKIIVIRSMSKFFCLPGLRVGYIICNQDFIKKIHNTLKTLYLSVSSISQKLANSALKLLSNSTWPQDVCGPNLQNLFRIKAKFPTLEIIEPDIYFFVCLRIKDKLGNYYTSDQIYSKTKIITRDCNNFGLDSYVRINLCKDKKIFQEISDRIQSLCEN
jgi:aspartate/methionine/tyrosine aminotransferase